MTTLRNVSLVLLLILLPGCHRTDDGVVLEGEEAEAALEEAGEGVREAGERVGEEARRLGEQLEPTVADAAVTARVKARLTADPEIDPFDVDVDTVDGVVTLSGEVDSDEVRREIDKLTRRTDGVRDVQNLLRLPGESVATTPPLDGSGDR